MRKLADLSSWIGTIDIVTDVFRIISGRAIIKNPTSVSTDGVLGRPNNWRSLDSRACGAANTMPTFNANPAY